MRKTPRSPRAERGRPVRICMVTPYGLDRVSGISTVVASLAQELAARGHPTSIVAPSPSASTVARGVEILSIPLGAPFDNFALSFRTVKALWRRRHAWDLLHLHQAHPQTFASAVLARALGRRALITFHLRPPVSRGVQDVLQKMWIRLASSVSTGRIFVSEHTRSALGFSGIVIHNGVDVATIRSALGDRVELRSKLGLEGFVVAFSGRRTRVKGYFELLEAVHQIREGGIEIRLITTGDVLEEEQHAIQRRIHELNLEGCLCDLGSREDHLRFLAAADAFALPSYAEGLPMSLLEAMAAGLPIVASRVGGIPEIIEDGREGFLIPPADTNALQDRLLRLAQDPRLRTHLAEAAFEKVRTLELSKMATAYLRLYTQNAGLSQGRSDRVTASEA